MNPRSARSWMAFQENVAARGGVVLESAWRGSTQPHRIRCVNGHEVSPRPNDVAAGQGECRVCSGRDPQSSWDRFQSLVNALGGVVLEKSWKGVHASHAVRCAQGHDCAPKAGNVLDGNGICGVCAGNSQEAAEAAFRQRVEELGGTVLEPKWLGKNEPHKVRCAKGHDCAPRPNNVQQGWGICRKCKGQIWDVFYVVADHVNQIVKFGVTSGTGSNRIRVHRADGFEHLELLVTGLPELAAPKAEAETKRLLAKRGARPVRGTEYFPLRWMPTVLEVAANSFGSVD